MSELRLYLRRDSLRNGDDCSWVLRGADGRVLASGSALTGLPPARRTHLVLAADLVSVLPARLPDLPERRLAPLLPGAAEAQALGDAEQLHASLLERQPGGAAWLAVIDREWLQLTLARLAALGVEADAALPEYLLLPRETGAWSLLRNEDGVLLRATACFGLALDQGEPPAGLHLALGRVSESQLARPQRLHLFQGNAVHPPAVEQWRAAVGMPVELCGGWSWRDPDWPEGMSLLSGRFAPVRNRFDWRSLFRPATVGIALLAMIQWAGVTIDWIRLSKEERDLKADMVRAAELVLPAGAAIVDPAWQVGEALRMLNATRGHDDKGMIVLLGAAGKTRPPGGQAELRAIGYEAGSLSLDYRSADAAWLDGYAAALSSRGLHIAREPAVDGGVRLVVRAAGAMEREAKHGH